MEKELDKELASLTDEELLELFELVEEHRVYLDSNVLDPEDTETEEDKGDESNK